MTFTFGAILPTAFAGVMALIGFTIYRFIRPVPKYILSVASRIRNRG